MSPSDEGSREPYQNGEMTVRAGNTAIIVCKKRYLIVCQELPEESAEESSRMLVVLMYGQHKAVAVQFKYSPKHLLKVLG